jgi:hypothetical protein
MPPSPQVQSLKELVPTKKPHPVAAKLNEFNAGHERILVRALEKHRKGSLPKVPTAPSLHQVKDGIKTLSTDMRAEHKTLLRLKFIRDQQANPYKRLVLPPHIDPQTLYPTKSQLLNTTKFGKSHKKKMYKTQTSAAHILLPLLKSGFLPCETICTIRAADPRANNLVDCWQQFRQIDFRRLQIPTFDWENENGVNRHKMRLRTAALLHYDLDLAAVQRYCGWRLTGAHRRQAQMLYWLSYILTPRAYHELWPGYVEGTPCQMLSNEHNNCKQYLKYRKRSNLSNVAEFPDLVAKQFNKEDAREITMFFPRSLADFIPNVGLIPLGINIIEGKKPRMYRHGTYQADVNSYPINRLVTLDTEPEITFGSALMAHLTYIWRTRASYPSSRILLYDDDVSGAFNQRVMHPDIVCANSSIWGPYLIISVGMHFGGTFCPSNFEPLARARCEIVQFLYQHMDHYIALNQEVIDLTSTVLPHRATPLAQATLDHPSESQINEDGSFNLHFGMYVDDGLSALPAEEPNGVNRLVTASVESAYLLLGYPGPIQAPDIPATMSWDKMVDRPITITRESLGILVNTDDMNVTIPEKRLTRLDDLMARHWNKNRKQFTARAAAQLIGNLLSCLQGCHWLRMATFHLQSALRAALKNNARRLARSSHFQALLAEKNEAWLTATAGQKDAKVIGLQSELARILWRCKEKTWIPGDVHRECEWLRGIIAKHRKDGTTWTRPLSHIVKRNPDWVAYQDASSNWGMGGHSPDLCFYWHVSWEQLGPAIVSKKTLNQGGDADAHINWLEYAAATINFAAVIVASKEPEHKLPYPPMALLNGDNTTANRVGNKGTVRSNSHMARAVARVHGGLQWCCDIGMSTDFIAGILHTFICRPKTSRHTNLAIGNSCRVSSSCPKSLPRYWPQTRSSSYQQ